MSHQDVQQYQPSWGTANPLLNTLPAPRADTTYQASSLPPTSTQKPEEQSLPQEIDNA
jgi:hypothetical protein